MKKIFLVAAAILVLAGCKDPFTTKVETKNRFNLSDTNFILKKGNNTITGNAFLRQGGGGVVTCAGSEVRLIPVTKYSTERIAILYDSQGYASADTLYTVRLTPEPPTEFGERTLKTICNSSGDFVFKNVPKGTYFVQTMVTWKVGHRYQGGGVLAVAEVKNNDSVELVITR